MSKRDEYQKLAEFTDELCEAVLEFLDCISSVPFRPADCDQEQAFELMNTVERMAGDYLSGRQD